MSDDISFNDWLGTMLSASQEIQKLLFWAGINGEMSSGQADLIMREVGYLRRETKALKRRTGRS